MTRTLLVLTMLAGSPAWGECEDGVLFFPVPGAVVPTNARFILEGVGEEIARVERLVGKTLLLKSKTDQVSLSVSTGWKSAMNRVAVVLRPSRALHPGQVYRLELERHLAGASLLNAEAVDEAMWTAGERADVRAPVYRLKPSISEGLYRKESKGLTRHLKIHTTMVEDSPAYLVVSIRRALGATGTQKYFVPLNGGEGFIGHGPCSGSFTFDDGRAYKAKVDVVDAAGNPGPALPEIEFHAPTPTQ